MAFVYEKLAAKDAVSQRDMMLNSVFRQSPRNRMIRDALVAGSASSGDAEVTLYIGEKLVARLPNGVSGASPDIKGLDFFPIGAMVPAGAEIRAIITDAAATNPLAIVMNIDDVGGGGGESMMATF